MAEDTIKDLKKKIEAILYSAGRAVDIEELSSLCGIKEHSIIKEAIKELKADFSGRESPLLLIEEGNGWKLTVGEKYLDTVKNVTPHTELDKAILETLAVIAYKQPVLQSMVIKIRTSAAYEHIAMLVEMGFISKEKKGRSFVLKPTGRFFDYFDLPNKDRLKELFKDIESRADIGPEETGGSEAGKKEYGKKKLGGLSVYETTPVKEEGKDSSENVETLGKLEVVEYPKEKDKEEAEEESEEEKERYDEKKAMDIITKLAEDKDEDAEEEDEEKNESIDPELDEFSRRKEKEDIRDEDGGKEEFEKEIRKKKQQLEEEEVKEGQNENESEENEKESKNKDEDTGNETQENEEDKNKEDENKEEDEEENEDKDDDANKNKANKNRKKSFDDIFEDEGEK